MPTVTCECVVVLCPIIYLQIVNVTVPRGFTFKITIDKRCGYHRMCVLSLVVVLYLRDVLDVHATTWWPLLRDLTENT